MWETLKAWLARGAAEELAAPRFEFNAPLGFTLCLVLLAVVGALTAWYCWPRLARLKRGTRLFLVTVRAAIVVLVLFMLLDPCIVGDRIHPGEHFAILVGPYGDIGLSGTSESETDTTSTEDDITVSSFGLTTSIVGYFP